MYAVVFMDAIHFHARNEGLIVKRAVYIAIGIDMEGRKDVEYSCAMKSHFRKFGNQMSGSGNHLCEFTRAVFYLSHIPPA